MNSIIQNHIIKIIIITQKMIQNTNELNDEGLGSSQQYKNASQQMQEPYDQNFLSNINELISQPDKPSPTQFFLTTLHELSLYLFHKKNSLIYMKNQQSFDKYLNSFSKQINRYDNLHKKSKITAKQQKIQQQQSHEELLHCYQKVPYAFFKQRFVLDFGQLAKNLEEIKNRQEELNDGLDLVQINLFNQIYHKFHQYYNVVSNLQYVSHSIDMNIEKCGQVRSRLRKVRVDFVQKSFSLKIKLTKKQNLQKTLKIAKTIKSLKKLPIVIKQILQSSLPYQCLSLLKSTKQSLSQVQSLACLAKTSKIIKQSQSLVQMGLNKRYADELYLYLEECQNVINLQQGWQRINSAGCVDLSQINNSMLGVSQILEESILQMQPSTSKNKRNEGKQYEIAMILIQSYRYIQFPADLLRIKIANSLRVFCKKFDVELTAWLSKILEQKNQKILQTQSSNEQQQKQSKLINIPKSFQQESSLRAIVQNVTVIFFVKHLLSFNEIMKDTIERFLGFLYTLYTQYRQLKDSQQDKFIQLFKQQLSILPAISKIVIQKLKYLMGLKNINGITFNEFKQWIGVIEYWKKYIDSLIEQNKLINSQFQSDEIQQLVNQTLKKTIDIFHINATINQLVLQYVAVYHSNAINHELEPSFADECWQPVQIPSQFVDVLNNIVQWHDPHINQNTSVTILNDSKDIKPLNKSMNKSLSQDYTLTAKKARFRVLKSNVMVDGVRYKISVSLLLMCQFLDQYVKMMRNLPECRKYIYERLLNIIDYYNNRTKQLILQAKARQFEKMKAKNISAKHICLVHNCLSVISRIVKQITYPQVSELRSITLDNLQVHKNQLIGKLSYLLKSKVETTIASFLINQEQKISQVNLTILNVFVQMMGIIDEYLQFQDKKATFKESIQIFMSKYFKQLLLKGAQNSNQNKILVQKMRFLRQYFPDELQVMERQAKASQK